MNIFVTTWIKLPGVKHNDMLKLFREGNLDKSFCTTVKRGNKKRSYTSRCSESNGIEEVKSRIGTAKFLVSDCFQASSETTKIPCWWCREKEGLKENGIPVEVGENSTSRAKQIEKYGFFCDDRCMYAFALERAVVGSQDYRLYKKACENIEMLHTLKSSTSGCLVPAEPWSLLKFNGGTMDYDMWKDESISFQQLPGYNIVTVSFRYLQS
jgi:hypothetical protein